MKIVLVCFMYVSSVSVISDVLFCKKSLLFSRIRRADRSVSWSISWFENGSITIRVELVLKLICRSQFSTHVTHPTLYMVDLAFRVNCSSGMEHVFTPLCF